MKTTEAITEGDWVKLPIGFPDSCRMAGFTRWFVQEVRLSGEVCLCRDYLGRQYTRTIGAGQVSDWEKCNAPKAWAS